MSAVSLLAVILGVVGCLSIVAWRARLQLTLFVVCITDGQIVYVKGRMPQRLLDDIADVVERERTARLVLTCRIEDGRPSLYFQGDCDAGQQQLFRNLVGEYPMLRLKQAARARRT
jgi:hypothetical protein